MKIKFKLSPYWGCHWEIDGLTFNIIINNSDDTYLLSQEEYNYLMQIKTLYFIKYSDNVDIQHALEVMMESYNANQMGNRTQHRRVFQFFS